VAFQHFKLNTRLARKLKSLQATKTKAVERPKTTTTTWTSLQVLSKAWQSLKGVRKHSRDISMMQQTTRRQICTYKPPMRLQIMLDGTIQMVPILAKQFWRWRSPFCSTPTLGWRSQQFWEEEVGEENWWNYQAWRCPWVKHEDVVLSGLGPVLRLCVCQDGGINKLHNSFYNIRLIGTPQAPKTRCLQLPKPKV